MFVALLVFGVAGSVLGQDGAKQIPKEVGAITGTFTGSWSMFGIDGQGQVIKKGVWTDTMKRGEPANQG
jgi:hypothetical protein